MASSEPTNELLTRKEGEVVKADPLNLTIKDSALASYLDKRIDESHNFFKKQKDLYAKQDRNKDYLMGKQWTKEDKASGQQLYMDNVLYEAMATNKAIALSRTPHLVVKPANATENARKDSQDLTAIFQDEMRSRKERRVDGISYKHIPVYYIGAIKPFWNPELAPDGDYDFTFVHPKMLIVDSTANSTDTSKHKILGNYFPITLEEIEMRFPGNRDKLFKELGIEKTPTKKQYATTIKIAEVWFDWYEREGDKWKKLSAVCWKYKKIILGKMLDPNYDWEGEDHLFTYDYDKMTKQRAKPQDMQDALSHMITKFPPDGSSQMPGMQMPQQFTKQKEYYNYFKEPRKPYILLGFDQWGEMVYDETSTIEQGILMQDNINIRGRQITQIAARARGKDIFSTASGLKKKDIENLDLRDPNTDLLVKGNPREVHEHIEGEQPQESLFHDQDQNRNRLFAMLGTNATTRGQQEKNVKAAKQAQLLKDSDFGRVDDMVEETINFAAEQKAEWRMQFIRLRYTVDHYKSILGPDGETTFFRMHRDMIQDGMQPQVTSSAVDKMMRKQDAVTKLKLKAIDPLTFFEDVDDPDPKGRAERVFLFNKNPDLWYMKFVKGQDTAQMAQTLQGMPGQPPQPQMPPGGQQPPGQPPQQPMMPPHQPTLIGMPNNQLTPQQ